MIILSRHREEIPRDEYLARLLAERFDTEVWSIPFLYDLRSFGAVVSKLRSITQPSSLFAPFPSRASAALLEQWDIASDVFSYIVDISEIEPTEIANDDPELERFVSQHVSGGRVLRLEEPSVHRWYPLIDRRECTGCLECVNFCLFGVYSIGEGDLPIVDQPDACRNGCPACSRVCPGAAILFPMHKDTMIAGRHEAQYVRQTLRADTAKEERRLHLLDDHAGTANNLDDLVDQVDRLGTT